ncbi:MAG: prolyl oligopeptidase family serine peptidase, partial [Gemmatimonadota bacterium]|nr:prolyl oligopeptidase family serine peptidase [Gemmatimonadota bacterium]
IGDNFSLSRKTPVYVRESGFFFRTYRSSLDDTVYPFALYLPESVDNSQAGWPLVLSLHGAWSNHANNMKRLLGIGNRPGEPDELAFCSLPTLPELPRVPGIIVCPCGRGTMSYHGPGAADVLEVMDLVREKYPVDPGRITVTGLSMGGNGVWEMALHHYPDLFAAVVPVCPFADIENWLLFKIMMPENMKNLRFLERAYKQNQVINCVENALAFPVHIFHSTDDPVVPVKHSEEMFTALEKAGVKVDFTRFDLVEHNSWDPAYYQNKTLRRLFEAKRERPAEEITFTTCRYEYSRYDWVEIERFEEYGEYARVQASWDSGKARFDIETENVARLNLYPQGLPGVGPGDRVKIKGVSDIVLTVKTPVKGPVKLALEGDRIRIAEDRPKAKPVKKKGLEGPIFEVLSSRVILVYGATGGSDEGDLLLEEALRFANWGELPDVHFMIKPDSLVTAGDIETSHLVLFGDNASNSLIGRINSEAPVRFTGKKIVAGRERFAKDEVAFKCVFPNPLNPDKLVLVNFAETWDYSREWFYLAAFKQLPDYFIYRRGSDLPFGAKVLKAGYFNEDWSW